jgi:hypothetical protein
MNESEFIEHLIRSPLSLSDWGVVEQVQKFIETTKERPRLGKAIGILQNLVSDRWKWLVD